MKIEQIVREIRNGRFVVWIDDKQNARLTPEYVEGHYIASVDSIEEGYQLCSKLQDEERKREGRAMTRYRISGLKDDYVCSEDLSEEEIMELNRQIKNKQESPD